MMDYFDKLQVLGVHGEESQSAKEKEAFHFAMDAIHFIMATGQAHDFEDYIQSMKAHAPPLAIARFATRAEAEEWLKAQKRPPDSACILIGDQYFTVLHSSAKGWSHLGPLDSLEYYLADMANDGPKPSGLSFESKAKAEAWLHQQPTPPQQVVVMIAGAPFLAAYHHRIDYRVLYPLPPPTPPASDVLEAPRDDGPDAG
ncbi:head protein [Corallococcus sp. ZKHCc1 1396]|uniref:Head protein n=1 Tax=Corallococcus soli TaxID=2710757 RepID=A0ABR9PSE2_9BACT|nr:head protein [Corallococcus soli]MBE4750845.1 head protein [Corallococcus soli]